MQAVWHALAALLRQVDGSSSKPRAGVLRHDVSEWLELQLKDPYYMQCIPQYAAQGPNRVPYMEVAQSLQPSNNNKTAEQQFLRATVDGMPCRCVVSKTALRGFDIWRMGRCASFCPSTIVNFGECHAARDRPNAVSKTLFGALELPTFWYVIR